MMFVFWLMHWKWACSSSTFRALRVDAPDLRNEFSVYTAITMFTQIFYSRLVQTSAGLFIYIFIFAIFLLPRQSRPHPFSIEKHPVLMKFFFTRFRYARNLPTQQQRQLVSSDIQSQLIRRPYCVTSRNIIIPSFGSVGCRSDPNLLSPKVVLILEPEIPLLLVVMIMKIIKFYSAFWWHSG